MTRMRTIKTTFTAGEVSGDLLGRGDLRAYENGAAKLRNVFIQPTGGVTRRAGTRFVDRAPGAGRLMSFEFNAEQTYLILLSALRIDIYFSGVLQISLPAPWDAGQMAQVCWTQSADTLLMTHPDVTPRKLTRTTSGWQLSEWNFFFKDGVIRQPYYKFAPAEMTLKPSSVSGAITLTASSHVFQPGHAGTRMRIGGKEVAVTAVNSSTVVSASVIETLPSANATIDWEEQAFSPPRGYPVTVAFHQDRLVIGGSRELPNRLWFSRSGDLFNFDTGTGLDDEAIEFGILSDQVNAIRGMFSGRHLQVFTSGAEWMVTGDPLTPVNVQVKRQTRIGSVTTRYVPPVDVDGATLYIARGGRALREFIYTDLEQAYQSTDLALLSRHVTDSAIDQDFDAGRRLLYLIRGDGQFATLTVYRAEAVAAWTLHQTDGRVRAVAVTGETVYLLVERAGVYCIEEVDDALNLDCALSGEAAQATTQWSGLSHLEGRLVAIVADGRVLPEDVVTDGSVTLPVPARSVEIGLPFTHEIEPLPPGIIDAAGNARAVRVTEANFRLRNSHALRLDLGRGLRDVPLRKIGGVTLDTAMPPVNGDVRVKALGWQYDLSQPLWRIAGDLPLPFTLLAVNLELKIND